MIIAEQKRKENIIEYILYIRQVQDIIRMTNFDIDKIDEMVISKFSLGEKIRDKIKTVLVSIQKTAQAKQERKIENIKKKFETSMAGTASKKAERTARQVRLMQKIIKLLKPQENSGNAFLR